MSYIRTGLGDVSSVLFAQASAKAAQIGAETSQAAGAAPPMPGPNYVWEPGPPGYWRRAAVGEAPCGQGGRCPPGVTDASGVTVRSPEMHLAALRQECANAGIPTELLDLCVQGASRKKCRTVITPAKKEVSHIEYKVIGGQAMPIKVVDSPVVPEKRTEVCQPLGVANMVQIWRDCSRGSIGMPAELVPQCFQIAVSQGIRGTEAARALHDQMQQGSAVTSKPWLLYGGVAAAALVGYWLWKRGKGRES